MLGSSTAGWADPPYVVNPSPVAPVPGPGVPAPKEVPGKEYSNLPNKEVVNIPHTVDLGMTVMWDGKGGVMNGWDFIGPVPSSRDVDAIANHQDALFHAVWNNQAHLVYSVTSDGTTQNDRERLWVEKWTPAGPAINGVWARTSDIHHDLDDLNGVEVWGPDDGPDSDLCSVVGDPAGVSVYHKNGQPYVTQAAVAQAIKIDPAFEQLVDLDGLMVWDEANPEQFELRDQMIFSIAPVLDPLSGAVIYDGGEIWTWTMGDPAGAQFLNHGGHLWDTLFAVQNSTANGGSENVDALEAIAVPEPAAWTCMAGLLCAGAAFVLRRRETA
jgi:hypothetical protein